MSVRRYFFNTLFGASKLFTTHLIHEGSVVTGWLQDAAYKALLRQQQKIDDFDWLPF